MVTRLRPTDDQNTGKEASGARHGGPCPPLSVCGRLRPKDDPKFKVHLSGTVSYRLALRYRVNLCPNPKTTNQRIIHLKPRPDAVVRRCFRCKGRFCTSTEEKDAEVGKQEQKCSADRTRPEAVV